MFALLALFVAGAAAAPQVPLYQYPVYPQYQQYYNYYPQQQLRYIPAQYPVSYYPGAVSPVQAQTRGIFGLDIPIAGFQNAQAGFLTDGTTQVIQGNAEFKQNIFTGSDSDYIIYMKEAGDLKMAGNTYSIYISDDCGIATAGTSNAVKVTDITAPGIMINGFYAKGRSTTHNVDATSSKISIRTKKIVITAKDSTTVVGCTGAIA